MGLHADECFSLWHQVLCGRRPCRLQSSVQDERQQQSCPAGQECLEHSYLTCFSPPCNEWGVCSMAGRSPSQSSTKCQPNSGHLDNNCGSITLVFNRDKVPPVSHLLTYHFPFGAVLEHVSVCFLCCWSLHVSAFAGNNSGEHLLWAEISSRYPKLGKRPRPSPALWPLSFKSGCCRGGYSKWTIQTWFQFQ